MSAAFILLSVALWRGAYALGDVEILALLPLAVVLFLLHCDLLIQTSRAHERVFWRDICWPQRWLTVHIGERFWALVVWAAQELRRQIFGASPTLLSLWGKLFFTTSLLTLASTCRARARCKPCSSARLRTHCGS